MKSRACQTSSATAGSSPGRAKPGMGFGGAVSPERSTTVIVGFLRNMVEELDGIKSGRFCFSDGGCRQDAHEMLADTEIVMVILCQRNGYLCQPLYSRIWNDLGEWPGWMKATCLSKS